jgi:hypothetical protein
MILGLDMDPLCLINPDPKPGISCPTAEKLYREKKIVFKFLYIL